MRAVLIERRSPQAQVLLLVAHHFVCDPWSMHILIEDIQTVYEQLARGQAAQLPQRSVPFQTWAGEIAKYARSDRCTADCTAWHAADWADAGDIPIEFPGAEYVVGSDEVLTTRLRGAEAEVLLHRLSRDWHAQPNEAFLAALAATLLSWTGKRAVAIDLFTSGRSAPFANLDFSRTVGWFSAHVPILIRAAPDTASMLRQVQDRLRSLPNLGIGYGARRWLTGQSAGLAPLPQVCLNNWGGQSRAGKLLCPAEFAFEDHNQTRDFKRQHLIDLLISGGEQGLDLLWAYSRTLHRRETIARLAASFTGHLQELGRARAH